MYSAVIFDVDGTLLDTEGSNMLAMRRAVEECTGREYSEEELRFAFGIPGVDALKTLSVPDIDECMRRWVGYFMEYNTPANVFDGIMPLLDSLYESSVPMGIVTSRNLQEFGDFDELNIRNMFMVIVTADDTERHKPHPDPIEHALRAMRLPEGSRVLYVGDTVNDSAAAHSAGIDFGLALWGSYHADIDAELYLGHPSELFSVLLP